ncbi:MAG: hypothetical protein G8237_07055 [Magnetococcales bacterium]|nr:hypothetical protein [Magnetococcales bacterium]NGZ06099.1 hypothetical protein [Magnetococcales bacterium]
MNQMTTETTQEPATVSRAARILVCTVALVVGVWSQPLRTPDHVPQKV